MSKRKSEMTAAFRALAVVVGTYCDMKLFEAHLRGLRGTARIDVVADRKMGFRGDDAELYDEIFEYDTNESIMADPLMGAANTHTDYLYWSFLNPRKASVSLDCVKSLGAMIRRLEDSGKYDFVVMSFTATAPLFVAQNSGVTSMISARPHFLLYLYPGVPNATVPWLFDARLRSPDFELYSPSGAEDALDSWTSYFQRLPVSKQGHRIPNKMRRWVDSVMTSDAVHHLACWEPSQVLPLKRLIPGMHLFRIGTASSSDAAQPVPARLRSFLLARKEEGRRILLVSFGSYGVMKALQHAGSSISERFVRTGGAVVYHAGAGRIDEDALRSGISSHDLFLAHGFVSYETLLPFVDVVAFTGSTCLQNLCVTNSVPMIMVPFITEQYFWAKNYQHFTGMPYVDIRAGGSSAQEIDDYISASFRALKTTSTTSRIAAYTSAVRHERLRNRADVKLRRYVLQTMERRRLREKNDILT